MDIEKCAAQQSMYSKWKILKSLICSKSNEFKLYKSKQDFYFQLEIVTKKRAEN